MFINSIPFLVTMLQGIKFIPIKHMPTQTMSPLKQSLIRVMQIYGRAGFVTQTILVDGQFENLKGQISNVVVNTHVNAEHVGDIE
ncbi:hypothetical protein ACHAXS_009964 [Conticribra weissflogii]